MCRLLAYLGPRTTLADLLIAPMWSLVRQAHQPRLQTHGRINADGFGVAWYEHERKAEPARYRVARPAWTDRNFASISTLVASTVILAAVRSATPGLPVNESCTPPYVWGTWAFAHNGSIDGFLDGVGERLRRMLTVRRASGIEGATDSEILFALALDQLDLGASAREALAAAVSIVRGVSGGRLTMLLTDGREVAATIAGSGLFSLVRDRALYLASEPFDDDPDWEEIPDESVVRGGPQSVSVVPLGSAFVEEESECRRPATSRIGGDS